MYNNRIVGITIATSTVHDGTMKSTDGSWQSVLPAREAFLEKHALRPEHTTLVQVAYETDNFCRYQDVSAEDQGDGITRGATIEADALITTTPGHALFLPLADCIGAVIHDPTRGVLMVSHLGRHSLEQHGGTKSIRYLIDTHDVDPKSLTVWLSPAAGAEHYPLHAFEGRSLHDVAIEQVTKAGVPTSNITASLIDTTKDETYYSHSQFLAGKRPGNGRFAIVVTLIGN